MGEVDRLTGSKSKNQTQKFKNSEWARVPPTFHHLLSVASSQSQSLCLCREVEWLESDCRRRTRSPRRSKVEAQWAIWSPTTSARWRPTPGPSRATTAALSTMTSARPTPPTLSQLPISAHPPITGLFSLQHLLSIALRLFREKIRRKVTENITNREFKY